MSYVTMFDDTSGIPKANIVGSVWNLSNLIGIIITPV